MEGLHNRFKVFVKEEERGLELVEDSVTVVVSRLAHVLDDHDSAGRACDINGIGCAIIPKNPSVKLCAT